MCTDMAGQGAWGSVLLYIQWTDVLCMGRDADDGIKNSFKHSS